MSWVLLLITFLALLAGLIAYTGDVLGTVIGKRRLSLFGVRPKLTGRIIGVGAGILIMALTTSILAITNSNAVTNFQRYQEFYNRTLQLEAGTRQLQSQIDSLRTQLELQQQEVANIQAQRDQLIAENDQLNQLNTGLNDLNDRLANEIDATQTLFASQQNAALELQKQLDARAQQLTDLQTQIAALEAGGLTYTQGQIIHSAVIAAQDAGTIREALALFLQNAQNKVTLRGAAQIKPLSTDDADSLIEAMRDTPDSDILIFSSPNNQFKASVVDYSIALSENSQILTKGQLLISQQIHLGSSLFPVSREDVTAALARLSVAARDRLLRFNAVADISLETTGLSPDVFAEQLLKLHGPVTIGMLASQDVYVSGPAQLEFVMIY